LLARRDPPLQPPQVAPLSRGVGGQLAAVDRVEQAAQHLGGLALVGLPHIPSLIPPTAAEGDSRAVARVTVAELVRLAALDLRGVCAPAPRPIARAFVLGR